MNNTHSFWKLSLLFSLLPLSLAHAADPAVPATIAQQGRLFDSAGKSVNGTLSVVYNIYESQAGASLWTETQSVQFADGYFSVNLGEATPIPSTIWSGAVRYLGVTIGADSELAPRVALQSVPYAQVAGDAVGDIHAFRVNVANGNWVGGAGAAGGVSPNPMQVALLRWWPANQVATFSVGASPLGLAFDGANVWVANWGSKSVTKLRANDGGTVCTYSYTTSGANPAGVAFDGANTWVSAGDNTLTKLNPDCTSVGTYPTDSGAGAIAFDGSNLWVATWANVTKLNPISGAVTKYLAGNGWNNIAFDGTSIWATPTNGNTITKLKASDGTLSGTYPVGTTPVAIAFDGSNIWVSNADSANITKLLAADGRTLGTFPVGGKPQGIAFDGANIWVTIGTANSVTKLRASDGTNLGTFPVGGNPSGIAFDGANMWVTNHGASTVSKL